MAIDKLRDDFLGLMAGDMPLLYKKFSDTEFFVAEGEEKGKIMLFYHPDLSNEDENLTIGKMFGYVLHQYKISN